MNFNLRLFYTGFPVFIALTKEQDKQNNKVFAATYSSSYILENQLVMGVGMNGQMASHLTIGTRLSINYLTEKDGLLSDIGGLSSQRTRVVDLIKGGAILSEFDRVSILENGLLTVIGKIEQIITRDGINHLFISITNRLISDTLIENDEIEWTKFSPLEYIGNEKRRYYKTLDNSYIDKGHYLKFYKK